ncbi:MAG: SNF2-related protein [Ktedonobacteraceae bacterium]
MIVIHAVWENVEASKLHLWVETSHPVATTPKGTGAKRSTKVQQPQSHPFALDHQLLQRALQEWLTTSALKNAAAGTLALRLPSTAHRPQPAPELILEQADDTAKPKEFKRWQIDTITLDAQAAFELLRTLPGETPHGVAFGSDLRFWATAAMFAFELITKECYIPALQETQQNGKAVYQAAWQASLVGEDDERMHNLAVLMPPACWSFLPPDKRFSTVPHHLLRHFLDHNIDAFVRQCLVDTPLLSKNKPRQPAYLSLAEQWLHGLKAHDVTLKATEQQLRDFASAMYGWLDQLRPAAATAPFRTCFRLDQPDPESDQPMLWRVSYYLQANDDRSLLVPADKVWQERSSTLTFLKRQFENPQERLLSDLGKATRVFPAIENSLRTARPKELGLTTEQAYAFLRESVPLLEQSGYGVLIPTWWQKPSARVRVKLKVKPKEGGKISRGLLGLDSIVAYDWVVSVGDSALSDTEFESLVSLKMPLVRVRGQWVELRPEEIEAAIAFFEKKRLSGDMTLGDALRLGLGEEQSEVGLAVAGIETEGWIKDLMDRLSNTAKIATIKQPSQLHGQLRPYQLKGASWMAFLKQFGFGACLADDMGLGKCIGASSLVTVNGSLQKAEDIWTYYAGEGIFDGEGYWAEPTDQLLTNSIDEATGRIVQTRIKQLYRQNVSEYLRKIRLEDGSSVTITHQHKLLTDKGWTNDLHADDYVCVPAKLVWNGKAEDPDLVKFLAWQIAEGNEFQNRKEIDITQKDPLILEELQSCLRRFSAKYQIKINNPTVYAHSSKRAFVLKLFSVAYCRFLEAKGYNWGKHSNEKCIPGFVMQGDLDTIRIFLQNYFEAEASVVESMRSIEISTASPMIIQQLSILLRRFGIWMRISTKQKRATNGSGIYRPYQIGVLGGNAARIFCKEIGFVSERKQGLLEQICAMENNTNVEGIPASDIMADVVATTKLPIRHFNMPTVYAYGSQQFSQNSLHLVISSFDSILDGETERLYREKPPSKWTKKTLAAYAQLDKPYLLATKTKLQSLINQEVYYCKIKSIEDVPYDGWVYDFEIEQHHNFVAENILCHNTIQMISLLLHDREQGEAITAPSLLICPMSIVGNWQRELQRFAPSLSVMIHHGAERLSDEAFLEEARQHDIVITTYSLALRDQEHLSRIDWNYLVIDEAQNIKNDAAKQTKAIKGIKARYRVALTGTPVENRLSELWSIMDFLNPRYLGSGTEFRRSFATPIEKYHDAKQAETLKQLIQPFVLRRVKTDKSIIKDLPDKLEMKVFCNLTQEQASLYEAVVKEMMEKIEGSEGIERKGLVLSTLLKLKQVCNHPAQFMSDGSNLSGRSGKLARLEEMLAEALAAGDKALIFTQFAEMGTLLRQYLQSTLDSEVLFLHGATSKKQRDMMVQRFQEERHGPSIFLLSIKAGGVGLNLTAANHVFHFDRWWNPAVENQATDRAFRIGQLKNVQVHKFVCVGTVEEHIDQMIEEKKGLAESIVGSGENWLTEMSTDQLKDLFALSRESVGE